MTDSVSSDQTQSPLTESVALAPTAASPISSRHGAATSRWAVDESASPTSPAPNGAPTETVAGVEGAPKAPKSAGPVPAATAGRGKPRGGGGYHNPTRHTTGGPQHTKLTPAELDAKMAAARATNDAIMARRAEVERDADEYGSRTKAESEARKKELEEKARAVREEKEREERDRQKGAAIAAERAANAARKLQKSERRDWDADKAENELWKANYKNYSHPGAASDGSNWAAGRGGRGGTAGVESAGRGRGAAPGRGGRGGAAGAAAPQGPRISKDDPTPAEAASASHKKKATPKAPAAAARKK